MAEVLIVEDDPSYGKLLKILIEKMGLKATLVDNLRQARETTKEEAPRLVILDRKLKPDSDGIRFCLELKKDARSRHIPVIVLTGLEGSDEEVKSYRFGADLYLQKAPETLEKLEDYVQAFLTRLPYKEEREERVVCGNIIVDKKERTIHILSKTYKDTPPKLFDFLYLLASYRGKLVSRDVVVEHLWSGPVRDRQVDVLVSRLKTFLGPGAGDIIESVRGEGYRIKTD